MGFRFRKRVKLIPGVWLNLSKGGISTSLGTKGVTVNLKDGKTRTTVGLPGTGISYSVSEGTRGKPGASSNVGALLMILLVVFAAGLLFRLLTA